MRARALNVAPNVVDLDGLLLAMLKFGSKIDDSWKSVKEWLKIVTANFAVKQC